MINTWNSPTILELLKDDNITPYLASLLRDFPEGFLFIKSAPIKKRHKLLMLFKQNLKTPKQRSPKQRSPKQRSLKISTFKQRTLKSMRAVKPPRLATLFGKRKEVPLLSSTSNDISFDYLNNTPYMDALYPRVNRFCRPDIQVLSTASISTRRNESHYIPSLESLDLTPAASMQMYLDAVNDTSQEEATPEATSEVSLIIDFAIQLENVSINSSLELAYIEDVLESDNSSYYSFGKSPTDSVMLSPNRRTAFINELVRTRARET